MDKDNLVAYYKFNEASGGALDAHGSFDLTQNGTVGTTSGVIDNARGPFSGSNYFSSTASGLQKGTGDFSFAFWAYNPTSSFPVLISKGWPGGEYVIYANGGDVNFAIGPSGSVVVSGIAVGMNFIVAVYDSTVPRLRLSLNGSTFVNATVGTINADSSDPLVIGCSPAQGIYWNTGIDEFAFWKGRALTQAEVTYFYNSGSPLPFSSWTGGATGQTIALGRATETESARSVSVSNPNTLTLGRATETEAARSLAVSNPNVIAIGRASETEQARALAVSNPNVIALGRATETESTRLVSISNPNVVALGRATESETARSLTVQTGNAVQLGRAVESESARGISISNPNVVALVRATETESARGISIAIAQAVSIGRATETETVRGVTITTGSGSPSSYYYQILAG